MMEKKEFTNVTFRAPTELYNRYKIVLLKEQVVGRKTPTAGLNYYIKSVVYNDRLSDLLEEEK
jgi:hypothetical protein